MIYFKGLRENGIRYCRGCGLSTVKENKKVRELVKMGHPWRGGTGGKNEMLWSFKSTNGRSCKLGSIKEQGR